jgi:hypothetical protein
VSQNPAFILCNHCTKWAEKGASLAGMKTNQSATLGISQVNGCVLRVCFKNRKRADFLGNLIGLVDRKAHENEMSY